MHTRASIGIVIPAFNAGQFLGATLQGVLTQTLSDWELVVVDDGSSDGTVGLVQQFALTDKRFRLVRQRNGGTARARNAGLAALSHKVEYVAFLDHDDVWVPHALSILREALDANPSAPAAHGLARKIDVNGRPLGEGPAAIQNYDRMTMRSGRVVTVDRAAPTTAAMVIYDNLICTPGAALIRREALRELGDPVFDPTATPLDDWDVWLRLAMQGDLAYIDRLVLDWRRHAAAGSYDAEAMRSAEMRIRERLMVSDLPEDQKAIADARYARLTATNVRREARDAWKDSRHGESVRGYARYLGMRLFGGTAKGTDGSA
jgi:glycosyltransferase involved in cell wall biosynthesis